jgi:hypothetical protein
VVFHESLSSSSAVSARPTLGAKLLATLDPEQLPSRANSAAFARKLQLTAAILPQPWHPRLQAANRCSKVAAEGSTHRSLHTTLGGVFTVDLSSVVAHHTDVDMLSWVKDWSGTLGMYLYAKAPVYVNCSILSERLLSTPRLIRSLTNGSDSRHITPVTQASATHHDQQNRSLIRLSRGYSSYE